MKFMKKKAQAVTELAVFGAILIFIIGGILRNAVDMGMVQNQMLKAMRWAMLQSLAGVRNQNKSRDSASVTYIEDRLSPDSGKTGSLERIPLIQSAAAQFSNTLLMPLDWGENHNIAVSDVFVNGKHFVFTSARFVVYEVELDPGDPTRVRLRNTTTGETRFYPRRGNWLDNCDGVNGCPIFYEIVPANSFKFCSTTCGDPILTLDQRFDLNRNDDYADDPQGVLRTRVAWQWIAKKGVQCSLNINVKDGIYPTLDIDFDRKDETVYRIDTVPGTNVVFRLYVLDQNEGDIDGTYDDLDVLNGGPLLQDRGLLQTTSVYTRTGNGTFLEINEGRAYVPSFSGTSRFVRSVTRKDQVDIISRMYRLDNDTGRFCNGTTPWPTIANEGVYPNPVEYCVNTVAFPAAHCFTAATVSATCYDAGTRTIFIRSRIADSSGRKWVTQTR